MMMTETNCGLSKDDVIAKLITLIDCAYQRRYGGDAAEESAFSTASRAPKGAFNAAVRYISANPTADLADLARIVGCSYATAEKARAKAAILPRPGDVKKRILDLIAQFPEASGPEIAAKAGSTKTYVNRLRKTREAE